jgi:type IV fimbrial biogenesis protein FimT
MYFIKQTHHHKQQYQHHHHHHHQKQRNSHHEYTTCSLTRRRSTGFTLLELLLTSCIVTALTAATLASFAPVIDRMRVISLVADFHSALSRARHEAVRRGQRIDLLPLAVGDWRAGWCVAIDINNNQRIDAGELVLHRGATALPAGVEITPRMTDSKRTYLAFDPSGRPRTAASASVPQYGSVLFRLGEQRRKLLIGFLGRVRVCDPDRDGAAC